MGISLSQQTIDLSRIGGEARYIVYVSGERIEDAYFVSLAPVRGFERIVKGKNPLFVVEAVMRICGLCHSAHGIAAVEAFEDALGVNPPANGRLLREALGLLNRVQSHLIHLILMTPDIVRKEYRDGLIIDEIKLLNRVNDIMTRIGGAPTHPPNIAIGGFAKPPPPKTLEDQIRNTAKLLEDYRDIKEKLLSEEVQSWRINVLREKEMKIKPLASHLFYGDKYNLNVDKVKVIHYREYRGDKLPEEVARTTTTIALYGDRVVETGPRARLMVYREFRDTSLWGLQLARLEEIELSLNRVIELLELVDPGEPSKSSSIVFKRGRGVGVYEAPRGTLIHFVELDSEGRIAGYKIIVPTMFNIPLMEQAAKGLPAKLADTIPRLYDPCIPCATHVIKAG